MWASYRRVSKKEQSTDGEALIRQTWQLRQFLGEREHVEFEDIQSGRKDDRPEYQRMLGMVEAGSVDKIVVTRIDRITRNLEENSRIAKLFERKKVEIFELLLNRAIDWKNPNDWEYFVRSGMKAESESRMLSARIGQTFDYHRAQGKMAGGRVGWPYKRDDRGFIVPDPDQWDKAVRAILIIIEAGGTTARALVRIREEVGIKQKTLTWLHYWARGALIRGHTPMDTRNESGYRRRKSDPPPKVLENTHPSLLKDPRLLNASIDAEKKLAQLFAENKRKKGRAKQYRDYPLSGLLFCSRCGGACHIKRNHSPKYPSKTYFYIMCGARATQMAHCGGEYGTLVGKKSISSSYGLADRAAIDALRERADELIRLGEIEASRGEEANAEPPEVTKLRAQIAQLEGMADPDLRDAISSKQSQLNRLLIDESQGAAQIDQEERAALIQLAGSANAWGRLTDSEKKYLYHQWIEAIICDGDNFTVRLKI
jgi:site-specific DNA recombinase